MTGLTKMYCYRMFRQKSLYIIWAITVVMILLNLQMIEQRTFSTLLCESGTLVTMLLPLCTAIFFSADHSSGFIKYYAGSVSDKTVIIAARAVIILIQNLLSCCVVVISGLLLTRSIHNATDNFTVCFNDMSELRNKILVFSHYMDKEMLVTAGNTQIPKGFTGRFSTSRKSFSVSKRII